LSEGLHITADFYPYPVGCGQISVFLPAWVMDGSTGDALARMADPKLRNRILSDMEKDPGKLADGRFSSAPKHPQYLGRSFEEVAQANGERVSEMLLLELDLAENTAVRAQLPLLSARRTDIYG